MSMITFEKFVAEAIKYDARNMSGFFWVGAIADLTLEVAMQYGERMVALGLAKYVDHEKAYLELAPDVIDRWKRQSD